MVRLVVIHPIMSSGIIHKPGGVISVPDSEAAALIACGAASEEPKKRGKKP